MIQRRQILFLGGMAIALSILLKFFVFKGKSYKLTTSCDTEICRDRTVVILHGLARSAASMKKMAEALNDAGYTVCNLQYPSRKYAIEKLAIDWVYPQITQCLSDRELAIDFVTHSMGGIIVRQLAQATDLKIDRVVMLSPPNRGSELVDRLKAIPLFKLINGEAGMSLGTDKNSVPNRLGAVKFETGIITGDRSYNPLYSYLIPGVDDGKVALARAKIEGMQDFLVVSHSHSFIMNNDRAIAQTIKFLKSGKFY